MLSIDEYEEKVLVTKNDKKNKLPNEQSNGTKPKLKPNYKYKRIELEKCK